MPPRLGVFPERVASSTGWLVIHESVRDSARIRCAMDALAEILEQNRALLLG